FEHSDPLAHSSPESHYHMSNDSSNWFVLRDWMNSHRNDAAVTISYIYDLSFDCLITYYSRRFFIKAKEHILCCILHMKEDMQYSLEDGSQLTFVHERIYKHKVLRINYTSYDMRRCQDSINPHIPDHSNVMVLVSGSDEVGADPYWYARVLGVFHVMAQHNQGQPCRFDFLWVCWYGIDSTYKYGWKYKRMPRIRFIDSTEDCAFGFLDPACVIRAVHLIPAFSLGSTKAFLGPSIARQDCENNEDWYRYYVGM
ncbi:hypothetical protein K435DRAFT_679709, partial [Dendrothele bispora CBS 962.96]